MRTGWLVVGVLIGLIGGRNATAMPTPVAATVLIVAGLLLWLGWKAANKDRATAIATAVATATAAAEASAEAHAQAIAQAAVHLHLTQLSQPVGPVSLGRAGGLAEAEPGLAPAAVESYQLHELEEVLPPRRQLAE